jgi:hypothetical protein
MRGIKRFLTPGRLANIMLTALLLAVLTAPADAGVRRKKYSSEKRLYTQRGFALSVAPGRMGYDAELCGLDNRRHAGGAQLSLEYGCCRKLIFFGAFSGVTYEANDYEEWSMGYVDFGLRYSFASTPDQRTRPYISGSIGPAMMYSEGAFDNESDHEYIGGSARIAAGIDYFLSRSVLMFVEVSHRGGAFDRVRHYGKDYNLADNPEFHATGFHVGFRFRL